MIDRPDVSPGSRNDVICDPLASTSSVTHEQRAPEHVHGLPSFKVNVAATPVVTAT